MTGISPDKLFGELEIFSSDSNEKQEKGKNTLAGIARTPIEYSVVSRALRILSARDSQTAACQKVSSCLANEVGLNVDFD